MENFRINRTNFSELFWSTIFASGSWVRREVEAFHLENYRDVERRRHDSDFNTGSISLATTIALSQAISYFRPRAIAEVGTFIGRSTMAMAHAGYLSDIEDLCIYTCDVSNDIDLDLSKYCSLIQFKKTTSTVMLTELLRQGIPLNALMIDGRVSGEDATLIKKALTNKYVIFLDDFEGIEKGVVNAHVLLNTLGEDASLIYPASETILKRYSLTGAAGLGVIIPRTLLEYTDQ